MSNDLIFQEVDLSKFELIDDTGYATHVYVEFEQYRRVGGVRQVQSISMSLTLTNHEATLPTSKSQRQIISVFVQPYASHQPGQKELIGAPCTYRAAGGSFVTSVVLRTYGNEMPRTVVTGAQVQRPIFHKRVTSADLSGAVSSSGGRILPMEVPSGDFQYHDATDTARWIRWIYTGTTSQGITGTFTNVSPVTNQAALLPLGGYEDVSSITCEPFEDKGMYYPVGTAVTVTPSAGHFLTNASFQTVAGSGGNPPINEVVSFTEGAPPTTFVGPLSAPNLQATLSDVTVEPQSSPGPKPAETLTPDPAQG